MNGPGRRTIFSEQALTLLQWLAIAYCNEDAVRNIDSQDAARVARCILGVPSYLEVASSEMAEEPRAERWLQYLTQNFAFNGKPIVGNAMARTWAILGRLHREATDLRPSVDIDRWLAEDYGLSLEQQLALSFALNVHLDAGEDEEREFKSRLTQDALDEIFSRMKLSDKERASASQLISAPLSSFRDEINGKTLEQLSWDQVPFLRCPLIQMDDYYLLQSPRALIAWMVEGPYYRALDSALKRGEDALIAFTARIGKLTERYVLELAESAHREPRLPGAGKVYGDKTYGRGAHSSDVTITYPHEAVLIEVASHRLTLEARRDGDMESLRHDLTEMVGRRPKQLQRCIEAIRPDQRGRQATLRFPHLDPARLARFWPVIVTASPLHWSPVLEDFLNPELQRLESRDDVEPLDVMAVEDLETMLAISERTGRPVSDLLATKASVVGPHGDLRTWVDQDRSVPDLARPNYLDAALTEILDITSQLLGFENLDESEESNFAA
jgi:hypothetical protein